MTLEFFNRGSSPEGLSNSEDGLDIIKLSNIGIINLDCIKCQAKNCFKKILTKQPFLMYPFGYVSELPLI